MRARPITSTRTRIQPLPLLVLRREQICVYSLPRGDRQRVDAHHPNSLLLLVLPPLLLLLLHLLHSKSRTGARVIVWLGGTQYTMQERGEKSAILNHA